MKNWINSHVLSNSRPSYFRCRFIPLPSVGVDKNTSLMPAWRWMTVILLLSFVIILRRALIELNREWKTRQSMQAGKQWEQQPASREWLKEPSWIVDFFKCNDPKNQQMLLVALYVTTETVVTYIHDMFKQRNIQFSYIYGHVSVLEPKNFCLSSIPCSSV